MVFVEGYRGFERSFRRIIECRVCAFSKIGGHFLGHITFREGYMGLSKHEGPSFKGHIGV